MGTLQETLDGLTCEGALYQARADLAVRCIACGHRCLIRQGRRGICQVRFNRNGKLYVPFGYVAGLQSDPIEKKPFAHVLPGARALTFGMLGCDYHCAYCQNWLTSQALRDPTSESALHFVTKINPEEIVDQALRVGAEAVVSSYNEPLITSEWAHAIFSRAKQAGLLCAIVSNGNNTPEVMEYLRPYLDACKIDLKTMNDRQYRSLGGTLKNTLDGIRRVHEMGIWLEVVTLVIPGFNDSNQELWDAARFLVDISPDIPWHVTAFHQDYKMLSPANTPPQTLIRAAELGREAGLRFVYAGNLPGYVGEYESTHCPSCATLLIQRQGYLIQKMHLLPAGKCPACGQKIAGIWQT